MEDRSMTRKMWAILCVAAAVTAATLGGLLWARHCFVHKELTYCTKFQTSEGTVTLADGQALPEGASDVRCAERVSSNVFGETLEIKVGAEFAVEEPRFLKWASKNGWSVEEI